MWDIRLMLALVFLFIAIFSFPGAAISKYGKKSRRLTGAFVGAGVVSTLLFMILIWPYIPD